MNLGQCITSNRLLPDGMASDPWGSIVVDPTIKERLINHAVLALTLRPRLEFAESAVQGLLALIGPPGTGKSTLARGLATQLCPIVKRRRVRLVEVNPHGLMSAEHGQSQQAVHELLTERIPELAESAEPTVVVIDEVESMAVARSAASLDANPVDVHRATDAVLTALDHSARSNPHLLYVVTSNFPEALDAAFLDRVDWVCRLPLPSLPAIVQILEEQLKAFGDAFKGVGALAKDRKRLGAVAQRVVGANGRQVRKLVTAALSLRRACVLDPNELSYDDLDAVAGELAGSLGAAMGGTHVRAA